LGKSSSYESEADTTDGFGMVNGVEEKQASRLPPQYQRYRLLQKGRSGAFPIVFGSAKKLLDVQRRRAKRQM